MRAGTKSIIATCRPNVTGLFSIGNVWHFGVVNVRMPDYMPDMPPILHVADITEDVFADLQDASRTYLDEYGYTSAFDLLWTIPERRDFIAAILAGRVDGENGIKKMREWFLGPWSSGRSLTTERLPGIGGGLTIAANYLRDIPANIDLAQAKPNTIEAATQAFDLLDGCSGVGGTIASKMLSALRPDLCVMWDIPIAKAYGFDPGVAGYRRFLQLMVSTAQRMRELWGQPAPSLEEHLQPQGREWLPPLAKFIDEWHWVRITRKHSFGDG